MWAGIKRALNSTLGTSNFKPLDKCIEGQIEDELESFEDKVRYEMHNIFGHLYPIIVPWDYNSNTNYYNPNTKVLFVPNGYNAFNDDTLQALQMQGYGNLKVILSNYVTEIGKVSWALSYLWLPQSKLNISAGSLSDTGLGQITLTKNISSIKGAFLPPSLTTLNCEFSRARAIELGYSDATKWGARNATVYFDVGKTYVERD